MMHLLAQIDEGHLNLASPVLNTPFLPIAQITVGKWIVFIINALLMFGTIAFFIYLLVGGVQWIIAGGDKEGTEKAKKRITGAIVGLAILFSVYAIFALVGIIFFGDANKILSLPIPKL